MGFLGPSMGSCEDGESHEEETREGASSESLDRLAFSGSKSCPEKDRYLLDIAAGVYMYATLHESRI